MLSKVKNGYIQSVNRSNQTILSAKRDKGGLTLATWYLKGKTGLVITCQAIHGGKLARDIKVAINSDPKKRNIMVTEDRGVLAISVLRRSDPFKPDGCRFSDPDCIVQGKKDCAKTGVIYEITCVQCSKAGEESGRPVPRKPGVRTTHN